MAKPKKKTTRHDVPASVDASLPDKIVKSFQLALTRFELLHLRDLFSVVLPNANATVSQSLALLEKRMLVEEHLWKKIQAACRDAKIQLSEKAPDYVIVTLGQPLMGVFQLATEPDEAEENEAVDGEVEEAPMKPELLLSGRTGG